MIYEDGVSVIIPVYKVFDYLENAINSVIGLIGTIEYEIIIVDDFSYDTDFLLEIEKKYPNIKLILNSKKGNAAISRNIGLDISKYRFVFFLDSDDYFINDHIRNRIQLHKERKEGFIFGQFVTSYNEKKVYSSLPNPKSNLCDYIFSEGGDVRTSTFSLDKKNLISNLRFDDMSFKHQDWIFAFLAYDQYFFDRRHGVVINVMHGTNMSMSFNLDATKYLIEKYIVDLRKTSDFSRSNCINSVVVNDSDAYTFFMGYFRPVTKKDHLIRWILLSYKLPIIGGILHKVLFIIKKLRWLQFQLINSK